MQIKETICIGEAPYIEEMLKQCLELKSMGYRIIGFIQTKTGGKVNFEKQFREACAELFIEIKTNAKKNSRTVIDALKELLQVIEQSTHTKYPESIYIFCLGPIAKDLEALSREYNIKSITYSIK